MVDKFKEKMGKFLIETVKFISGAAAAFVGTYFGGILDKPPVQIEKMEMIEAAQVSMTEKDEFQIWNLPNLLMAGLTTTIVLIAIVCCGIKWCFRRRAERVKEVKMNELIELSCEKQMKSYIQNAVNGTTVEER